MVEAPDGKTAIEQAQASRPALIAQDMQLPDVDGFDLLEQLRALPGLAEIPIIAVTGFLPERSSGTLRFNDVLIKPVEPSRLIQVINAHVASRATVDARIAFAIACCWPRTILSSARYSGCTSVTGAST